MMARTPLPSSVVAPTRIRPSLMVNGICAEATDKRAGRQRRLDDLLQPDVVLRLPVVAGADRDFEGARIEPGEFSRIPASRFRCRTTRRSAPRRCGPGSPASSASRRGRRASRARDSAAPCHRRRRTGRARSAQCRSRPASRRYSRSTSPPPILPLMASKVSDWPSLLTVPLTGCNSPPPGSTPRNA